MRPVLILQHQVPERAAYLRTWLDQHNISYEIRNAGAGEDFPTTIDSYEALAVMGGGMCANDPLISNRQAEILILQAVLRNRPVIGHCLGGQLMSRALGGIVDTSPQPEIGWQPIQWESDSLVQHWFGDNPTDTVIQWHYDAFTVPTGAVKLAASAACPNQAWALGSHLAMQFHIEVDAVKVRDWVSEDDPKWAEARGSYDTVQDSDSILAGLDCYLQRHQRTADHVYRRWLSTTGWRDRCPA